jgi:hypothetical protein
MQPVEVVDPRLAAGRGDEFRASTQRARVDELVELAALEGEDFRCGCAPPLLLHPHLACTCPPTHRA